MKAWRRTLHPAISIWVALLLLLVWSVAVQAGSHPLTKHETTGGVGFFDLVVSLNWEPDQADKDGRLKNAFEQFAKDVYMMSEGKQKVRKLYVFTDSEQMNSADVRMLDVGGRSNANAGGIFHSAGRILTYTKFSNGTARSDSYIGHTIAHEFGHYAYALFDEYQGSVSWSLWPSKPRSGDNPRPTIMNYQGDYQWFSIAADYDQAEEQKTAQWRYYGSSAWDTLVRATADDNRPWFFRSGYDRVRWSEFDGVTAPTALTKPSAGWDSDFEIIYMEKGGVAVLVIDDSGSMSGAPMASAKDAAKQFVDLMNVGEKVAVVGFDSIGRVDFALTEITGEADKTAAKSAIDGLVAGGGTNFTSALATAQTVFGATTVADNRYVIMMTDGQASQPSTTYYQNEGIPIYTIGLGSNISSGVLQQIAAETGGTYTASPSNEQLANIYAEVRRATAGGASEALAGQNEAEVSAGASVSWITALGPQDGTTRFRATWTSGTVAFQLTNPSGVVITPDNLPAGVAYSSGSTYAIYTVDAPAAGDWTAQVTSENSAATNVTYEVTTQSTLSVAVSFTGGAYPEPIGMTALVAAPEPVVGATVVAKVSVPDGADPVADIALLDDGVAPDREADDGVYSGVLAVYAADGDYGIKVVVSNPNGVAALDTSGALESGDDAAVEALSVFERASLNTVEVSDVRELPSAPADAQLVPTDNTDTWGAIAQDEAEVWYKFDAIQDTTYYIQTNSLISWDATEMATAVTLYDTDTVTELDSSAHYGGSSISYIVWAAPAEGTYYLKVAHASPGTGAYALTVGETSVYTDSFDAGAPIDTSDSDHGYGSGCSLNGGSGGNKVDPTLPLLFLFSMIYLALGRRGRRAG